MTTSSDAGNYLLSAPERGLNNMPNYGQQTHWHTISEARQDALSGSPTPDAASVPGRGVQSRPAKANTQKPTLELPAKTLNPPDRQAGRPFMWVRGDGWAMEIIAATCSLCCFVAIIAVLKAYDGQRSPSLPFSITLNAIISILSTTAKSSIMFGITAAIGQAKWDRFSSGGRYRPLLDLEYIDQASRGPLGSFRILFTTAGRSISSVGAIVTLLMLAVDPFVQQILLYQQEPTSVSSELAWTEQVLAPTIFSNHSDPVYFGMFNSALWNDEISYERRAHCPTLNCTYPPFQSMGLCVTTRQVPLDQVSFGGKACEMTYSNTTSGRVVFGDVSNAMITSFNSTKLSDRCSVSFWGANTPSLPIRITSAASNGTAQGWNFPLDFTGPMGFDLDGHHDILGVRNPLIALGRISWSSPALVGGRSLSLQFNRAEQAVIAFCAGDYETIVSQGNTSTSRASMSSPSGFSYYDSTTVLGPNATCWTSGSDKPTFPRAEVKQSVNGRYISKVSPLSFCTDNWGWGTDISSRLTSNSHFGMDFESSGLQSGVSTTGRWFFTGSSGVTNQDALRQIQVRGLTSVSRSMTASLNALFRKYSSDRIVGFYTEYDTVVRVQWPWLTLPVAVEVLGFIFLLWVALRSSRPGRPWKGSILATLFHGLNPSGKVTDDLDAITSMEQEAMKTMVKLEASDGGRRFLHTRTDGTF